MDAIKIENLTFSYDQAEKPVLNNLSLTVKSGEFLAVVGRNASGKSTLARLITGLLTPNEGTIEVLGIVAKKPKELFEIMKKDKKALKDKITFILPCEKKTVKELQLTQDEVLAMF